MTKPSTVYFGPDGCGTCGRKDPDHADWCEDVRGILAHPDGRRAQRFRDALPAATRVDWRLGQRWSA